MANKNKNADDRISIHAPHEGERQKTGSSFTRVTNISIHAPHEGERLCAGFVVKKKE